MFVKSLFKAARRTFAIGFTLLTSIALAQSTPAGSCAAIVTEALQAANSACSATSRNQVCYGNILGAATPAEGVTDLVFEDVGDIAALAQIQSLQLSPLNEVENQWGVALMQLQANLPDTLPGQNVTFLMFGDVTIQDNTGEQASVEATANTASNLRLGPNTTSPIVGSVPANARIIATGKATNSLGEQWVRVRYEEYRTRTGWVLADLVTVDFSALPDVQTDSLTYSPMQAFYFRTGIGQQRCSEAPIDGVLVQTPQGAGKVSFNVNGIDIALGSTAFLTAPESEANTCVSLLTGDADLQSNGRRVNLDPGERSCAPRNADGTSGVPGAPEPFDPTEIQSLAVVVESLPNKVTIPDPAPVRTATPFPTPAPTAQPTSVPTNEPPPATAGPTPTTGPQERYINVSRSRTGTTVIFTATSGPEPAESYFWYFGEGYQMGPVSEQWFSPGESYSGTVVACWDSEDCIDKEITGNIPACAIEFYNPSTLDLTFTGTDERYRVFRRNENCDYENIAPLNEDNPYFSTMIEYNEYWQVRQSGMVIREYIGSGYPIYDNIPETPAR